ncbi:type 4a pilus biogenesis protein PilO [Anaerobranca gottschalkii]|uniref:Tfp pilus assembly protein PilO n=1 Tax=Anaerobranca gottschalkii DSM 13577 TaxID=1120990 RepID=A0A1H9Y407_9FIRM|nr:type 4a pilus biogenesis protein PilO [Anaerobranca gottschalkii]SES63422.1 Tfp pilus assembly protein PilO [Anaerobranca gottschalkii DSM 13577]
MKEILNKLNEREKKMLLILFSLIVVYVLYNYVITATLNKREEYQSKLETLEMKESNLNLHLVRYNSLKTNYGDYQLEDLRKRLPEEGYIPEVLLWIENIFQANGIDEPNIQMQIVNGQPSYLQLNLTFRGDYNSVYNLLQGIEGNERIVQIENYNFSGDKNLGSVNLTLRVYGEKFY